MYVGFGVPRVFGNLTVESDIPCNLTIFVTPGILLPVPTTFPSLLIGNTLSNLNTCGVLVSSYNTNPSSSSK